MLRGWFRKNRLSRLAGWLLATPIILVLLVLVLSFFVDEPLRKRMEANLNNRLKGYTVRIERLDFHPIGFSLDLENSTIFQNDHPDPPVAFIPNLSASVEWQGLLFGRLVADFQIDRPKIYINRKQVKKEVEDPVPMKERGWQKALESIYPLKIDHFAIEGADLIYVDEGPRPLHLKNINLRAENIRNVRSPENVYPSQVEFESTVFEKGKLIAKGNANFLAEPHVAFKAAVTLDKVELDYFKPIIERQNFIINGGVLSGAGQMEYAANIKVIEIPELTVSGLKADYIQKSEESVVEKSAKEVNRATQEYADDPTLEVRVHRVHLTNSEVGFINKTKKPEYRVFLSDLDLKIDNFTNRSADRPATAVLKGKFMGTGDAEAKVSFRPNPGGPDMDIFIDIDGTDMRTMNDLFRAYGNFDVAGGRFSFYSEITVRKGMLNGYVKPLFQEVNVYDRRTDREKGLFRQLYEGLIGGISWLLQNTPRDEVATRTTISGKLSDPRTSTLQIISGLIQNAFFKSILPGFEREVSGPSVKRRPLRNRPSSEGDFPSSASRS